MANESSVRAGIADNVQVLGSLGRGPGDHQGLSVGAKAGVVTGEHQEVLSTGIQGTVDKLGRPLAPCGCLLHTEPPPVPDAPPFVIGESNVKQLEEWFYSCQNLT